MEKPCADEKLALRRAQPMQRSRGVEKASGQPCDMLAVPDLADALQQIVSFRYPAQAALRAALPPHGR
jgi:hypothetical protein